MSRRTVALATVALVVIASAGGWLAGSQIKSPAEVAARTGPPVASPILAPAEVRVLSTRIVTRGTARFTSPRLVSVMTSLLKANAAVVSSVPVMGNELTEGEVALTTSGRPVFVLEGSIPSYRDLGPGLQGNDVLQLEEALVRLGHDPGPVDGIYDSSTGSAVAAWYTASGWQPFEATTDQLATIRALEMEMIRLRNDQLAASDAIAAASADLAAAKAAAAVARDTAAAAPDSVRSTTAEAAAANQIAATNVALVTAIRDRVALDPGSSADRTAAVALAKAADAELARARAVLSNAEQAGTSANQMMATTSAGADAANQLAAADVANTSASRDLVIGNPDSADADIAAANTAVAAAIAAMNATASNGQLSVQQAQAAATAASGERSLAAAQVAAAQQASIDANEALQRLLDPAMAAANLAAAERDLVNAKASAEATRLAGVAAVNAARNNVTGAQRAVGTSDASAAAAARRVESARTFREYLAAPASQLSSELATAHLRAGTHVPADEIIFLPSVPARIEQVTVAAGDQIVGPVFTATGNELAVDASLQLDEAPLLKPGMAVTIDEPALGISGSGVVGRVADKPGTNGVDGFHVYLEILVLEAPISIVGASVRLTIPIESSGGSVLAVPISALSLAADGSSRVEVQRNGALASVVVEPGLVADGFVAITPKGGSLQAGELVVIGFEQPVAAASG